MLTNNLHLFQVAFIRILRVVEVVLLHAVSLIFKISTKLLNKGFSVYLNVLSINVYDWLLEIYMNQYISP